MCSADVKFDFRMSVNTHVSSEPADHVFSAHLHSEDGDSVFVCVNYTV